MLFLGKVPGIIPDVSDLKMFQRYRSDFVQKLNFTSLGEKEKIRLSEWKIALYGLFFSISVITAKVIYASRNTLRDLLFEDKLLYYETVEANGQMMLHYFKTTVLRSSNLLLPVVCGLVMTAFTWLMVYLDSSVPGIQPPTPFSPTKYKILSGHSFHLGYIIAVVNGILVFLLILINGV